jgi:2-keto-4-pentenoate hydratase/2-oxohepta-3-ene-1,7-dioic acid hydratase in catechol pathway
MRLVTFERKHETRIGMVKGEQILDLSELLRFLTTQPVPSEWENSQALRSAARVILKARETPQNMIALFERGPAWLEKLHALISIMLPLAGAKRTKLPRGLFLQLDSTRLRSPILRPPKIICVGRNYGEHARESGHEPPANPIFFQKASSAICDPSGAIRLPALSRQVDYEAELAVVIARRGHRIPVEQAHEYIAGYTLMNDVSARDMQELDGQWFRAKSCDTFAPLGPWIVTPEEIHDAHSLRITLTLDGQLMQDSNTRNLIFQIPFLISYLSRSMTWEPGDILATGTPPGVGVHRTPPVFLKAGSTVSISVEHVGTLTNTVVDS